MIRLLAVLLVVALGAVSAQAQIAITGGRVVTNTEAGIIDDGVVVISGARIAAVGAAGEVAIPPGAEIIDASGQWVTPGLFAAFTRLGLVEVGAEDDADDRAADEAPYSAALDVAYAFNPRATSVASSRIEGVTRAAIAPAFGDTLFAGQGALAELSGEFGSLFAERAFMLAGLDQGAAARAGGARTASWAYFNAALGDARAYPSRYMAHPEGDAVNRYDAAALTSVARGETPLMLEVDRASDILAALRFQRRNPELRIILAGASEARPVADDIAAAGVPVIIDPVRNLPENFDAVGASFDTITALEDAGVLYAIAPLSATEGDWFNVRLMPQHAGNAVAHGLSWDAAFEAISLAPARIFGVDDELGALAPGMLADVVVWDGDPLELMSAPTMVMIEGEQTSLHTRQTELRDRYLPGADNTDMPPAYRRP